MVSIKQLKYFEALARLGHFGQAAASCSVTQPALSMQIQDMERTLGVQLLERRTGGLRLTDEGLEIARRTRRILTDVRDLEDFARQRRGLLTGQLRLGVIPSIAPYLLPAILRDIRSSHPDLDLHIRETQTHQLLQQLTDGGLDVLLLALPVAHPEIETLALAEDRFLLAMPAARQLPNRLAVTADLLAGDRLLLLEEGHCLRDQALAFCSMREVNAIDTFGASSLSTLVQLVANGLGLTLLPEISVDLEARRSDIQVIRFAAPEPSRTIGLAWRATTPRKLDYQALGQLIRRVLPIRGPAAGEGAE